MRLCQVFRSSGKQQRKATPATHAAAHYISIRRERVAASTRLDSIWREAEVAHSLTLIFPTVHKLDSRNCRNGTLGVNLKKGGGGLVDV